MTKQVQNKGMKSSELNVGGTIVRSDENGVFDVDDVIADRLLKLPGFSSPRITVELQTAYEEHRKTSEQLMIAETAHQASKVRVSVAQAQAERGEGKPLDGGVLKAPQTAPQTAPQAVSKPVENVAATPPPTEPPAAPSEPQEPGNEASDAKEAAARLRSRLGSPSMRWKLDDLLTLAAGMGIEADSSWSKASILQAIEDSEEAAG